MTELERLLDNIDLAEQAKREFVRENPNGTGDKAERARLYRDVEMARRSLRAYRLANPHLFEGR